MIHAANFIAQRNVQTQVLAEADAFKLHAVFARAQGKLNNPSFVGKAPQKLVDAEREKVAKYEDMKAKCLAQLQSL